jgi:uncharacterized membrane protein
MPIEFRCDQCSKLLRTPDDTQGQQAKCPMCGAVMIVPSAADESAAESAAGPVEVDNFRRADSVNPYQAPEELAPQVVELDPAATAAMPIQRSSVDFGDVISRTWNLFAQQWSMCVLIMLPIVAISFVGAIAGTLFGTVAGTAVRNMSADEIILVVSICVVIGLGIWLFTTWLSVGAMLFFIKTARGLPAQFGDLFAGGPYFLRIIGGSALYGLAISGLLGVFAIPFGLIGLAFDPLLGLVGMCAGMMLGLAPAVIFMMTFMQFKYLIIDRNMGIMESFRMSREVMQGNRAIVFLIVILVGVAGGAINQMTCNLGMFVVMPFTMLLYTVIYLAAIGHPSVDQLETDTDQI